MFTDEEITAAKATRDAIVKENISELKSIYMAGEIVMWDEMQAKKLRQPLVSGSCADGCYSCGTSKVIGDDGYCNVCGSKVHDR